MQNSSRLVSHQPPVFMFLSYCAVVQPPGFPLHPSVLSPAQNSRDAVAASMCPASFRWPPGIGKFAYQFCTRFRSHISYWFNRHSSDPSMCLHNANCSSSKRFESFRGAHFRQTLTTPSYVRLIRNTDSQNTVLSWNTCPSLRLLVEILLFYVPSHGPSFLWELFSHLKVRIQEPLLCTSQLSL